MCPHFLTLFRSKSWHVLCLFPIPLSQIQSVIKFHNNNNAYSVPNHSCIKWGHIYVCFILVLLKKMSIFTFSYMALTFTRKPYLGKSNLVDGIIQFPYIIFSFSGKKNAQSLMHPSFAQAPVPDTFAQQQN